MIEPVRSEIATRSAKVLRVGFLIAPGMPELFRFLGTIIPVLRHSTEPFVDFADLGPPSDSSPDFLRGNQFDPGEMQRDWDRSARGRSPEIAVVDQVLEAIKFFGLDMDDDVPCIQVAFAPDFTNPIHRKLPLDLCITEEGRLRLRELLVNALGPEAIERVIAKANRRGGSLREAFATHWDSAVAESLKTSINSALKTRWAQPTPPPRGWVVLREMVTLKLPYPTLHRWVSDTENEVETKKDERGRLLVRRDAFQRLIARKRRS